jgi:hypothetical protein
VSSAEIYDLAISEAERFLEKARAARRDLDSYGNAKTAAAKRASMDLTRALAVFRRG